MGPCVLAAASAATIAKLCSIGQKQGPLLKTLSNRALDGVIFASMPVAIALGVSAKIAAVAAVATATFYMTSALFNSKFKMKLAFAITSIGGTLTYATLASCGPIIAGAIGIAGGIAGALLGLRLGT